MTSIKNSNICIPKINLYSKNKSLLYLFFALNLAITLPLAAVLNVWIDEYYSLSTSGSGLEYAIHQALFFELQPPLYYALLSVWLKLNHSVLFARCFSVICIIFAIYISTLLSKKYLKDIDPKLFIALITLNPFTIYAAIEIRPPALGILLSALMLLFFFDGYLSEQNNNKPQIFYIFSSILAIYTQYYLGFLLIANALALVSLKRWDKLRSYFFGTLVIGAALIPIISIIPYQIYHHTSDIGIDIQENIYGLSIIGGLNLVFERLSSFVIPSTLLIGSSGKIFRLLLLLFLLYVFCKKIRKLTNNDKVIWTINITLLLILVPLSFLVSPKLMQMRHISVLFLPTMLLICTSMGSLRSIKFSTNNLLSSLGLITISFTYLFCNYSTYKSIAKPGDWRRVASYIQSIEKPFSPIVVFNGSLAPLLKYYYSGQNSIVPLPKAEYFKDIDSYREISKKNIENSLFCMESKNDYLFLVNSTYFDSKNFDLDSKASNSNLLSLTTSDRNSIALEAYIKKHYDVEIKKYFYSTQVRFLRKKKSDSNFKNNYDKCQSQI